MTKQKDLSKQILKQIKNNDVPANVERIKSTFNDMLIKLELGSTLVEFMSSEKHPTNATYKDEINKLFNDYSTIKFGNNSFNQLFKRHLDPTAISQNFDKIEGYLRKGLKNSHLLEKQLQSDLVLVRKTKEIMILLAEDCIKKSTPIQPLPEEKSNLNDIFNTQDTIGGRSLGIPASRGKRFKPKPNLNQLDGDRE